MSARTAGHPHLVGGFAFALVRRWVRFYTFGMSAERRERRRAEIECDLWENCEDRLATEAAPATVGLELVGRCLRGAPADLFWRYQMEGPAMNIHFAIDRVAGALLLGTVIFLLIGSSISGYDPAANGFDGELRRAAGVNQTANLAVFTLSGIGLLVAAAGLTRAFRDRAPMLAQLCGAGLSAAGTLVLVSTAFYAAFASLAEDYVTGEGAAVELAAGQAHTVLVMMTATNMTAVVLAVVSVWGLALFAAKEQLVPGWLKVFPLISVAGAAILAVGGVVEELQWGGFTVSLLGALLWLVIAGGWIAFGGNERGGQHSATPSAV